MYKRERVALELLKSLVTRVGGQADVCAPIGVIYMYLEQLHVLCVVPQTLRY